MHYKTNIQLCLTNANNNIFSSKFRLKILVTKIILLYHTFCGSFSNICLSWHKLWAFFPLKCKKSKRIFIGLCRLKKKKSLQGITEKSVTNIVIYFAFVVDVSCPCSSCRRWNLPGHLPGFHPHGLQRPGQAEPLPAVRPAKTLTRQERRPLALLAHCLERHCILLPTLWSIKAG